MWGLETSENIQQETVKKSRGKITKKEKVLEELGVINKPPSIWAKNAVEQLENMPICEAIYSVRYIADWTRKKAKERNLSF